VKKFAHVTRVVKSRKLIWHKAPKELNWSDWDQATLMWLVVLHAKVTQCDATRSRKLMEGESACMMIPRKSRSIAEARWDQRWSRRVPKTNLSRVMWAAEGCELCDGALHASGDITRGVHGSFERRPDFAGDPDQGGRRQGCHRNPQQSATAGRRSKFPGVPLRLIFVFKSQLGWAVWPTSRRGVGYISSGSKLYDRNTCTLVGSFNSYNYF